MSNKSPIGIFDSGYGGLTILSEIQKKLPNYDFIYLGDNSRAPYGSRSFEIVYEYTLQAVKKLFSMGCNLVILACNTASAKALKTIQQNDLPNLDSNKRVLGIIRPTAEIIGKLTQTNHIGILGTTGTILSQSYELEIKKHYPDIVVNAHACPIWAPLVENNEYNNDGTDFFIKKDIDILLNKDNRIDSIILACTHYPLLIDKIKKYIPKGINLVSQGSYVAESLREYLERHSEIEEKCSKNKGNLYLTTENPDKFKEAATDFLKKTIDFVTKINLEE